MNSEQAELLKNLIAIIVALIPICGIIIAAVKWSSNMNNKIHENERRIDKLEAKVDSISEDIMSIKEENAKHTAMLQFIIDSINTKGGEATNK